MTRLVVALAVVAAVSLTGCFPGVAANKGAFTANVQQRMDSPGTSTPEPPGRTVKGQVWKGTFTAKLTGQAARTAKKLKLKLAAGSFVSKWDGQEDFSIGKASGHGIELVTFNDKKTGSMCVSIDFSSTDHGESYTGTWKTIGGSGKLAKFKGSGTMKSEPDTPNPAGGPAAMTGAGSAASITKAKKLTAACLALKSA